MEFPRIVYAIRNNTTNRMYIGSSSNVFRRIHQHFTALQSHRHPILDMQKDFDEHGDSYTVTILDTIENWSERDKEYEWQAKYQSNVYGTGYNYQDTKWRTDELAEKRTKLQVTFKGKTMGLAGWATEIGIHYTVLYDRIFVRNWDVEKAMTTPVGKRGGYHGSKTQHGHKED